jgi:subtilase family serine protease
MKGLFACAVVACAAALTAGSGAAATSGAHRMSVNPLTSPAGTFDPSYNLFRCQRGVDPFGRHCYDPYQMRHAYGTDSLIAGGNDGRGKTIVIVDAFMDPNIANQLNAYDSFYGLAPVNAGPGTPTFTQVAPDGLPAYDIGWAEEITLDVEWAHAIAPGANIVLEEGKTNSDADLISAVNDAINNNRGDVISMSFGESDQCLGPDLTNAWHQAFVNATKKGITLFASSGDQGAAQPSCDGNTWIKSTSSPASDPLVTGVGGTELQAEGYPSSCLNSVGCTTTTTPGTYDAEIGWNEGPPFGDFQSLLGNTEATGGGYSTIWSEPSYQKGTIHGGTQRGEPDVSYNAAIFHGVLTYLAIPGICSGPPPGCMFLFGGTSAGSPQWAALTAIADQAAGHDYGFINAAMYKAGQTGTDYANAFNDITSGTNSAEEFDASNNPVDITGFDAGTGWDAVTGLGSPKAGGLLGELAAYWSAGQGTAAINNAKNG